MKALAEFVASRARPIRERVEGAPYQPGDLVVVVAVVDSTTDPEHVGKTGRVDYLEYDCGCGQSYPDDPMIGVDLGGQVEEFWRDELVPAGTEAGATARVDLGVLGARAVTLSREPGHYLWLDGFGWHDCTVEEDAQVRAAHAGAGAGAAA